MWAYIGTLKPGGRFQQAPAGFIYQKSKNVI
jgi:hypothetical protein